MDDLDRDGFAKREENVSPPSLTRVNPPPSAKNPHHPPSNDVTSMGPDPSGTTTISHNVYEVLAMGLALIGINNTFDRPQL